MHELLSAVFLVCFLFGAAFTFISVLTGAAHISLPGGHALHLGHLGHLGHVGHLHVAGPASGGPQVAPAGHLPASGHAGAQEQASPLNIGSLLAFLTWFGGVGYLLLHSFSWLGLVLILLLATVAGVGGAALIILFLFKVLLPAETVMDPESYRLDGTPGRITAGITAGSTGEIMYSKAGTRRSDAARSIDGEPIPRDTEVVILTYRRGIAYVQALDRYLKSSAREIAGQLAALDEQRSLPGAVAGEKDESAGNKS